MIHCNENFESSGRGVPRLFADAVPCVRAFFYLEAL